MVLIVDLTNSNQLEIAHQIANSPKRKRKDQPNKIDQVDINRAPGCDVERRRHEMALAELIFIFFARRVLLLEGQRRPSRLLRSVETIACRHISQVQLIGRPIDQPRLRNLNPQPRCSGVGPFHTGPPFLGCNDVKRLILCKSSSVTKGEKENKNV